MNESLLIGIRGWEHDEWQDGFYDDALPTEWRLCYYSNIIRSVLVPAQKWESVSAADLNQWIEDIDEGFRFVLELPAWVGDTAVPGFEKWQQQIQQFQEMVRDLRPWLSAYLLRISSKESNLSTTWLQGRLEALDDGLPVCVDLPMGSIRTGQMLELLNAFGASLCWRPNQEPKPEEPGEFMVALMGQSELKPLRAVVEQLGDWMGDNRGAGLFFTEPDPAPQLAEQVRIIAELLDV
ncbi:MAG TPA: DUF72 domain-containing protein [Acidiferrobacteraceae bacterium]|nr:DUF72 domain-containing protein [Acidiferrobacteraceae bacterium]